MLTNRLVEVQYVRYNEGMFMKRVTLLDFLTREEIEEARKLQVAREIRNKIIDPNIQRINRALGQKNDPMYLAYMVEYVIGLTKPNNINK